MSIENPRPSAHNTISHLIFDLGGVIVNLDLPLCIENFKKLGVENIDHLLTNFGQSGFFLDWEKGNLSLEDFRKEIRKLATKEISDNQIDTAWASFLLDIPEERIELLRKLKNKFHLSLLSNTNPIHAELNTVNELNKHGESLESLFDHLFFSYKMGLTKPHSEIYKQVIEELNVEPANCLFLDDGQKNIVSARSFGIPSYLVKPGENLDFLLDDHFQNIDLFDAPAYTATIGFFDGVHAGHQFLINELKEEAKKRNQKSLLITFDHHPRKILHSTFLPKLITSQEEKINFLEKTGADKIVVLPFNEEFSKLSAEDFMTQILNHRYNVKTLLIGHDHRFGHNRNLGFDDYVEIGKQKDIEIIQAQKFSTIETPHISSSDIRIALEEGKVEKANILLGRPYSMKGIVTRGYSVGRKIGFPTANLDISNSDKLVPGLGVYAVKVNINEKSFWGMLNIGYRPTLENGSHTTIEVHILDFDEDIYNKNIEIIFIQKIREERKFENIEALIQQLLLDKKTVVSLKN